MAVALLVSLSLTLYSCPVVSSDDVFASSAQLRMLDAGERNLIDALKTYVGLERQKLETLEGLIAMVEEERIATGSSVSITSHPVDVFHLIHRFTTTWRKQILALLFESSALEEFKTQLQAVEELIPTEQDYDGAKSAIIRLQRTYELPVNDVINGTILGHSTRPMSQQMAVDVALLALSRKSSDEALGWLAHAQNHLIPPLVPMQDIYHAAARIYAQQGHLLQAVEFVKKALELDPTNGRYLSQIMPEETEKTIDWPFRSADQDRLCREYALQNTFRSQPGMDLSCFIQRGRVVPFLRTKVEYLHRSPDLILFHDFITDNESGQLQLIVKSKIKRAMVGNSLQSLVSEGRVGKTAWVFDNSGEPLVDRISQRIQEFTGLDTKHPHAEALQLSNYGLGGHYSVHYDHDPERYTRTSLPLETIENGDRIATLMIYLNHVEAGGATVFPQLNLGVRPVKNAAIFWFNYNRSGYSEAKSLHAACPVLIGEKWVANKWFREFGQVFRRPCDLTMDE